MSDSSNIQQLAISDLVINDELQVRRSLDGSAIGRYAAVYKADGDMPPVRVARITDSGALVLVDGWHRIRALRSLGIGHVSAEICDASMKEARWLAACANLTHGVPLKSTEMRNVFRAYVHARKHLDSRNGVKSYRKIAAELGGTRDHTTIRAWMKKDFPKVARRMGGSEESGCGEGGCLPHPRRHPEQELVEAGLQGAESAAAAARGIRDPDQRGLLVGALERALKAAKEAGPWTPENDDF